MQDGWFLCSSRLLLLFSSFASQTRAAIVCSSMTQASSETNRSQTQSNQVCRKETVLASTYVPGNEAARTVGIVCPRTVHARAYSILQPVIQVQEHDKLRHAVGPVGEMQHQPRRLVLLAVGIAFIAFGLQLRGFNFLELQIAHSGNVKDVHQSVSKRSRSIFIALVSVSPLSASAQNEDFQIDPTLIFAIVLVFGSIVAGLSWVASLKPKKFGDGQPRSTSLYRVFQARMRAGEFAALAEAEKAEKEKKQGQPGEEDAELDAFVDAYVDALEEDSEPEKQKVDLEDGEGSSALKPTDKK